MPHRASSSSVNERGRARARRRSHSHADVKGGRNAAARGDTDDDEEEEGDDDFVAEALADAKAYKVETEKDRKGRAEARLLNKRYVKKRRKRQKTSPGEELESFDRLRILLGLSEKEAKRIRKASDETMMEPKEDTVSGENTSREDSDNDSEDEIKDKEEKGQGVDEDHDSAIRHGQVRLDDLLSGDARSTDSQPSTLNRVRDSSTHAAEVRDLSSDLEEEDLLTWRCASMREEDREANSQLSVKSLGNSTDEEALLPLSSCQQPSLQAPFTSALTGFEQSARGNKIDANDDLDKEDEEDLLFGARKRLERDTSRAVTDAECRPSFMMTEEQSKIGPMCLDAEADVWVPRSINRFLRDYQREGVRFFYEAYRNGKGALLGDDMGLGKTIQVIAFLSAIMKKRGTMAEDANRRIDAVRAGRATSGKQKADKIWPTCLIICPSSVVGNWQSELDTWGYFEHAIVSKEAISDFAKGRLDILLTSHESAKLQIDRLNDLAISCIFVDECHKLKNPMSQLRKAMCSFACPARFGLTGTAIQNRVEEMWALLDWCNPDRFGTLRHWRELVAEPLRRGQVAGHHPVEVAKARDIANRLVNNLLPTFFLRRTKALIKDQLPVKTDKIVFCPLTKMQIASYKRILDEPECIMIRRAQDPCMCGRVDEEGLPYQRRRCCYQTTEEGKMWNYYMFRYISLLQSCSNHLALTFPDPQDNITTPIREAERERKDRYARQLETVQRLFPDDWASKQNNSLNGFREDFCGKWIVLKELMADWKRRGDKLLIFTSNKSLLNWLGSFIEMQGTPYLRLDGSTPQKKRQSLVDAFNRQAEIFAFLISTTAGGTGLNLTGANKVVVFDPNWNPAHDLQAMDRAYRFGQLRDVDVFRLIGKGSLEEVIYDRQLYKQQMGRIGYEASKERRYFAKGMERGFKHLFELHETELKTKDMIEACDVREAKAAFEQFAREEHLAAAAEAEMEAMEMDLDEFVREYVQESKEGRKRRKQRAKASQGLLHDGDGKDNTDEGPSTEILRRGGISYTHINDELLGESRAEEAMSRYAREKLANGNGRGKKSKSLQSNEKTEDDGVARASSSSRGAAAKKTVSWPPRRYTTADAFDESESEAEERGEEKIERGEERLQPQHVSPQGPSRKKFSTVASEEEKDDKSGFTVREKTPTAHAKGEKELVAQEKQEEEEEEEESLF